MNSHAAATEGGAEGGKRSARSISGNVDGRHVCVKARTRRGKPIVCTQPSKSEGSWGAGVVVHESAYAKERTSNEGRRSFGSANPYAWEEGVAETNQNGAPGRIEGSAEKACYIRVLACVERFQLLDYPVSVLLPADCPKISPVWYGKKSRVQKRAESERAIENKRM